MRSIVETVSTQSLCQTKKCSFLKIKIIKYQGKGMLKEFRPTSTV
jgi:hypothetical protein